MYIYFLDTTPWIEIIASYLYITYAYNSPTGEWRRFGRLDYMNIYIIGPGFLCDSIRPEVLILEMTTLGDKYRILNSRI